MRASLSLLTPLAVAALCAAARPAAAQHTAFSTEVRPAVQVSDANAADEPRTVASYRIAATRRVGLPAEVTVADAKGTLVASYRLPGAALTHPMVVTVIDTDLVLQGETPSGVLTLQLYKQNDADAAAPVSGRWSLGGQRGELRARATR